MDKINVSFSKQKYKSYLPRFYWKTRTFTLTSFKIWDKLVGGVTPKGGTKHLGLPVFNTVAEAKKKHRQMQQ